MMISYGDDSLDKTKTRVFAASSVVARKEDWKDLYERWSSLNGDRPFHAADCESDRGDFASTNHESNKRLYAKNVGLIVNSKLIGAGVSISIQDYKQIFPFAPPENDWPYYMCFGGALACVARIAQLSVPPERVQVYFDQNRDRDYNTGKLYDLMVHQPNSEFMALLDDQITFANHRNTIGIQVADLLAYESMKDLDNILQSRPRNTRQSLIALRRSKRFEYVGFDRVKLEAHRMKADAIHADPERGKIYSAWLVTNHLKHGIQSSVRFVTEELLTLRGGCSGALPLVADITRPRPS